MADFQWPWEYSFPPFFTIQPNADTQSKQLESWCALVTQYCKHHRIDSLVVSDIAKKELFGNAKIDRKLSKDNVVVVLDSLATKGNVEWLDGGKERCVIMWRSPQKWADIIHKWATDNGMSNTVCTLFELREGETGEGEEFFGLDRHVLRRALQELQKQGKAELFTTGDEEDDSDGVKFF